MAKANALSCILLPRKCIQPIDTGTVLYTMQNIYTSLYIVHHQSPGTMAIINARVKGHG